MLRLDDRVALVTGAAGHLGLSCCEALAEQGARIVVCDRELPACEARASDLARRFGVATRPLAIDLRDGEAATVAIEFALQEFGSLDVLVNNAAYTGASGVPGYAVPFDEQKVEAWDAALHVNLTAPFLLAQRARAALSAHSRGSIINVGSIYGVVGPQMALYEGTSMGNPAAYGASKGGLVQLTRYLATVMAPSVRVNCISPGGIERGQPEPFRRAYRERTPLGRMATEEDIKSAFAYFASDASAYVTGTNLCIDGGWSAW